MQTQDLIVCILVTASVVFLILKFIMPIITNKKKDDPENGAGCDNDCNCK